MSDLLKVLNASYDQSLPLDARTLLKTDISSNTSVNLKNMSPGFYYHFGVSNGIKNHYIIENSHINEPIKLVVGIDGLPLTKSSKSTFWPILCYIRPYSHIVFPIGLYWGNEKPQESNDYLFDFVNEIKDLINNGIEIKVSSGEFKKKQVILDVFCCDLPAKNYILKTKGHNAYFSCSRCCIEGEYVCRRVCYPDIDCPKRTHESFINKHQEEYHVGEVMSILIDIPGINIINSFSLDYLHMVCIGVTKKIITLWLKGPLHCRLNSTKCKFLNVNLLAQKLFITCDFQRKPRGVDEVFRWKATEFRTFLLYLGPVVLKNIIDKKLYSHFLYLNISMLILLKENSSSSLLNFSNELLKYFVKQFASIYGIEWISQNIHGLQHITDDYLLFGSLDNCSTFPFENHMKVLKKYIRKSNQPLQQAIKRYSEETKYGQKPHLINYDSNCFTFEKEHNNGPLVTNYLNQYLQYKVLNFKNTKIKITDEANCYILTMDDDVVKVVNIICQTSKQNIFILGYAFKMKTSFYKKPIESSKLNIFVVDKLSSNLDGWPVEKIKCKCIILKCGNQTISFPIIHTYKD